MNPSSSPEQIRKSWKDLYIAALFESDEQKIIEKIANAQTAIQARRRELTISTNDIQEREIIDKALVSLRALSDCLSISSPGYATAFPSQESAGSEAA
jgi:hypothetical protein